ncbi:unnamed protein product, partial [Callosobruchus maculatus]
MMITFLTFCGSLLLVGASDCNKNNHCPVLPAATTANEELSLIGDNYLYSHQRYGQPIVADKCWSSSFFLKDYNLVDDVFNLKWTLWEKSCNNSETVKTRGIGSDAKYLSVFNDKEIVHTKIVVTSKYIVNYMCSRDEYSLEIFTTSKKRDEKLIKEATEAAKKL